MFHQPIQATVPGPPNHFTGQMFMTPLHQGQAPSRLGMALVRFTPGARTNWHKHPAGQVLYCTDGVGFVANRAGEVLVLHPGEVVHTPPDEEHWHGGTSTTMMCHIAAQESVDGAPVTWLEPVSDEDYERAHDALS